MKIRNILIITLIIISIYLTITFLTCNNYNGSFHFSQFVTSFHLEELITTEDQVVPTYITRIFHNKFTTLALNLFDRYMNFFNVFYLINILGIAGLFGLIYFYYSLFAKTVKNNFVRIFGIIILLIPFLEIFQLTGEQFYIKILFLILPYQIVALLGSIFFLQQGSKLRYGIYLILLLLSTGWIFVFGSELRSFCTTI